MSGRYRDPWPLPLRRERADLCTMDGHGGQAFVMTRRYANVSGTYTQIYACILCDGDAARSDKINPTFGRKRCRKTADCLRRWEHPGNCP